MHLNSNISPKYKKGLHTCSNNGISVLEYMKGLVVTSLNVNCLFLHNDEDLGLHILAINEKNVTIVSMMLC